MQAQSKYILQNKISLAEFEMIKNFILQKGAAKTYRNFDNNNPHFDLDFYEIYLGSDVGQKYINNNPKYSDFNELVVQSKTESIASFRLIAVRKGDVYLKKNWITTTMIEENIYIELSNKIKPKEIDNLLVKFLHSIRVEMEKSKISCANLWEVYDKKPKEAVFVECKKGKGQTVVEATYRVKGQHAILIENLLIQEYGMGKLVYTRLGGCSLYIPYQEKTGQIRSEKAKEISKNDFYIQIRMDSENCVFDENDYINEKGKIKQPKDLDYLTVTITIFYI